MSDITIIGGHGKVALQLSQILTGDGHRVNSVIRSESQIQDVEDTGANAVVADVQNLDTEGLTELLTGQDAVVWSAGAGGGDPERTYAVDRDAAIRSMDAAQAAGVNRYVMVSYIGAGQDHGIPEDDSFYAYAQSKADADDHLRASSLKWTILGPGTLTDDETTGMITLEPGQDDDAANTARGNVALVAAAALTAPDTTVGRKIDFADGDTVITEALANLS
ncbi:NAD-dependent dehydratase [Kocuria sp. WRN011]|uniref:SDR family oxidoreductase n=1 Tax=Kocuria carniphila TaxID=262208 RepID=A0ABV3UZN1_9MICC|nr:MULTISPECIES: SDR family oxidoreductase [Kocuria]MCT1803358.1 SDR family oxidoreductase [Kocuria carniphila]PBB09637.1 NAD-dependent dehydratase [Kocuria sp. WRN011]PZP37408.1 MAG: SDR family NAD(P)-dependent oxidoreductase [Kocuria rhizophila]